MYFQLLVQKSLENQSGDAFYCNATIFLFYIQLSSRKRDPNENDSLLALNIQQLPRFIRNNLILFLTIHFSLFNRQYITSEPTQL